MEAYKDNSAALEEYARAVQQANEALVFVTESERVGLATKQDVETAVQRVTEATYLYNDAIKDSIKNLDLQTRAQIANMNVEEQALVLQQKGYESLAQSARASGDYAAAIGYEISAKQIQIEIIKLTTAAKKLEADASIAAIEIERAALDLSDPMIKQKQVELDIRIANARAKQLEAEAGGIAVQALEREIEALIRSNAERDRSSDGRRRHADSIDREADALDRKIEAMGRERESENGGMRTASGPTPWRELGALADNAWNYVDSKGNWRRSTMEPVADPKGGFRDPDDRSNLPFASGMSTRGGGETSLPGATRPVTQTVNLSLNAGKITSVNVASSDDARALTSFLRQIETAAGVSGT